MIALFFSVHLQLIVVSVHCHANQFIVKSCSSGAQTQKKTVQKSLVQPLAVLYIIPFLECWWTVYFVSGPLENYAFATMSNIIFHETVRGLFL